jgi:hypothetical protein
MYTSTSSRTKLKGLGLANGDSFDNGYGELTFSAGYKFNL